MFFDLSIYLRLVLQLNPWASMPRTSRSRSCAQASLSLKANSRTHWGPTIDARRTFAGAHTQTHEHIDYPTPTATCFLLVDQLLRPSPPPYQPRNNPSPPSTPSCGVFIVTHPLHAARPPGGRQEVQPLLRVPLRLEHQPPRSLTTPDWARLSLRGQEVQAIAAIDSLDVSAIADHRPTCPGEWQV